MTQRTTLQGKLLFLELVIFVATKYPSAYGREVWPVWKETNLASTQKISLPKAKKKTFIEPKENNALHNLWNLRKQKNTKWLTETVHLTVTISQTGSKYCIRFIMFCIVHLFHSVVCKVFVFTNGNTSPLHTAAVDELLKDEDIHQMGWPACAYFLRS